MAWNDAPKAFVFMSDSQGSMQINFDAFKTAFAVNHYDINDALSGNHKKLDMIRQTIDETTNVIDGSTIGFYDKVLTTDELYIKTSTDIIPVTYTTGNTRMLPSTITIKTGFVVVNVLSSSTQSQAVTFETPFVNIPYAIFLSQKSTAARNLSTTVIKYGYETVTKNGFTLYARASQAVDNPSTFFYIALGV